MKKTFKKIIAVVLALVIGTLVSVQAFAATSVKKYISEVTICYASSAEEAARKLKEKGFTLADKTDLNSTLDKGTYIGYKLTDNADEAITDLAVMNMSGDYSYTDYETMVERNREKVDTWVNGIISIIKEYRVNYEDGIDTAIQVHDYLNKITEDVSGKGMGDFLLECSIDNTKHDELTDVFMKGNSALIASVEQALALVCDSSDSTWITRLEGMSYDDIENKYLLAYKTINKAENAMTADYGDTASEILKVWDDLYSVLRDIETKMEVKDNELEYYVMDEEYSDADEAETADAFTDLIAASDIALYDRLAEAEYDGSTLLEFFNRPSDEVEEYEVYPLCEALSEGQKAQISMSGLRQLILSAIVDKDETDKTYLEDLKNYIGDLEEISIYDGVDLDIYEKGVALTSDATKHESSSTDHWYNAFLNPDNNSERWGAYVMFYILPTVVMTAVLYSILHLSNVAHSVAIKALNASKGIIEKSTTGAIRYIFNDPIENLSNSSIIEMAFKSLFQQRSGESMALSLAKSTCFILVLILLVVDIVMLIDTIKAEMEDLEYEDIPHHILDATSARAGIDYVMYKVARTTDGQAADLNGYCSDEGWLVLYYTKDTTAGTPITSLSVKNGNNSTPSNCKNVHLFGLKDAVNITSKSYTGESDSNNGTYLFAGNDSLAFTASSVTNGIAFAVVIAGLAVGVIVGWLAGKRTKKSTLQEV